MVFQNMLEHGTLMRTEENVAVMCAVLHSVLIDQQDQPANAAVRYEPSVCQCLRERYVRFQETEDFEDEQHLVARMVHLVQADSLDEQFLVSISCLQKKKTFGLSSGTVSGSKRKQTIF